MTVQHRETAPCAHTFDILAVQACKQVRLANSRQELFNAANQYLDLVNSESIDVRKGYHIVDNTVNDCIELWKKNEAGELTCPLLIVWIGQNRQSQIPKGIFIHHGNLSGRLENV